MLKGYIPAGAAIFEMSDGARCPPTKWGMWLLVIGRVCQLQPPTRRYEGIRMLPLNRPGELPAASRARSKTSCIEEVTAEGQRAAPEGRGAWAAQHQGGKTEPQPATDAIHKELPPTTSNGVWRATDRWCLLETCLHLSLKVFCQPFCS